MTTIRRALTAVHLGALLSLTGAAPALAQGDPPAGGAELGQIVIATTGATVLTIALLVLGVGHRSGRLGLLSRAAAAAERVSGVAGWASLTVALCTAALITAAFGMYWDISLHADVGRDAGPLANPAHYFILAGLFGIFAAGFFAVVLPLERPGSSAVRITADWHAPLGGLLLTACGAFALTGFPLDDAWHRIFGQDVTLWGPTHLMLIGGAAMSLVALAVLWVEGLRAGDESGEAPAGRPASWVSRAWPVSIGGGLLIGLSTFQAEFDFGVPQFRFVFQPILIALAAGIGLVAVRTWLGRGSALAAVAFFLGVRGAFALLVGPVFGQTTPHFPLYLAEAVVVELVALRLSPRRPVAFGALCGALIGTVGLAAEAAWSWLWMPLPWTATLLPEAALLGLVAAVAAGLVGAWIGTRLGEVGRASSRALRPAAVLAAAAILAVAGYALHKPVERGVSARVATTEAGPAPGRSVTARVAFDPPSAADGAEWVTVTGWQGGGVVVDRLERIGPGRYRTTRPVPVHGTWKTIVRLHRGDSLGAVALYLPRDGGIPAPEVPARAIFERPMVSDHEILQREQRPAAAWLTGAAYSVVLAITAAFLVALAWGLHRLGTGGAAPAAVRLRRASAVPVLRRVLAGVGVRV